MKKTTGGLVGVLFLIAAIAGVSAGIPGHTAVAAERPAVRFEPSSAAVIAEMVRMAEVTQKDLVYDLGCGDGRVVIAAARTAGARGVGVDIDPELIMESRKNAEACDVAHLVQFRREDLYEADISKATVVMLFLSPEANLALRPRLLGELKPGSRIVSHCHDMGDWKPDSASEVENHRLYSWIVPARVAGRWRFELADKYSGGEYVLEFEQAYQQIRTRLSAGRDEHPVSEAGLKGKTVRFRVETALGSLAAPVECSGDVEGDRIEGKCRSQNHSANWTARRAG